MTGPQIGPSLLSRRKANLLLEAVEMHAQHVLRMSSRLAVTFATLVVLGLTSAISAAAATGPAYCGALNMLHDPTMMTVPMVHDAPQGNAGMFHAVAVSCP
jgi:hypothetical protein